MESLNGRAEETDMEFAELLENLGVSRNLALLIAFLASSKEASSKDIENGAGISQAGVSIAIKALREKGWIEEQRIRGGKWGRTRNVYRLKVRVDEIIRHFEREMLDESVQVNITIQRLKELASA